MEHQLDLFASTTQLSLDPDNREWEYDNDGSKIYKVDAGYGMKTSYTPPSVAQ
jgi:hypothetical protein